MSASDDFDNLAENATCLFKGIGKAKSHFWGIFKSFKSIISGVIQPLGDFFHAVG